MSQIRHAGIYVHDLEKMKSFYCHNFDMQVQIHDFETGNYINTILNTSHLVIELYKLKSSAGMILELLHIENAEKPDIDYNIYNTGCMHLAFTVPDVEQFYECFKKQGVNFLSVPCISNNKKAKVCFCQDPEGNFLELVEELQEENRNM